MMKWFACVSLTPKSNSQRAKPMNTSGHFRDISIHQANKASSWCLSLQLKTIWSWSLDVNRGWSLDIECCLMGQHDTLKKYWQSSHFAETLQVVISNDGGRTTNAISTTQQRQHQNCAQSNNQWLDISYSVVHFVFEQASSIPFPAAISYYMSYKHYKTKLSNIITFYHV